MLKNKKTVYFCQECGYESAKWMGQCPGCKSWNTFVEETVSTKKPSSSGAMKSSEKRQEPVILKDISLSEDERQTTQIGELDRVLGGGIVPGSLVLVGGDPGIGKSTLLLQVCRNLAEKQVSVLYISGEESLRQIKLRANRIGQFTDKMQLLCETNLEVIREVIERRKPDVVVIVDEAYVDFGAATAQPLLEKYENLLVVQTTSKSRSLAGMRIGYAIGNEKMISYLNDVKYSFNSYTMNQTTIAAGAAAIRDVEYFRKTVIKVMETREWSKEELKKLGFSFEDSKSNFIFATHKSVPAGKIFQALRERHIYVRYFEKPRIDNYLRITIGTREEMQTLFDFLKDYLTESSK